MDENYDEEPPSNDDPFSDDPGLDDEGYELPESEEIPPEEIQARLEEPTAYHWLEDELGNETYYETDPLTEPGVEPVWPEPETLRKIGEQEIDVVDESQSSTGGTP